MERKRFTAEGEGRMKGERAAGREGQGGKRGEA